MKIDYTAQRAKYKGMSRQEIVRSMDIKELKRNSKKGGVDAISELERREAIYPPKIIPQPDIDIGV